MQELAGVSVLFVDDNDDSRYAYERLLTRVGMLVQTAASGEDALARVALRRPDVIVMDVAMPLMSGIEAAAQLRSAADTRDIPIVGFSAYPESTLTAADRAHFDAYCGKPCHIEALVEAIRHVLSEKSGD